MSKNGLSGFRTQIGFVIFALDRSDVGFKHEIKGTRLGQQAAVFGIITRGILERFGAFACKRRILNSALLIKLLGQLPGTFRWFSGGQQNRKRFAGFLSVS